MNIQPTASHSATRSSAFGSGQFKRWLGIAVATLMLAFAGNSYAGALFLIDLTIENNQDSNGNILVINGSKVIVAFNIEDDFKLLHKLDKIQLLSVDGDKVLASASRGKKLTGKVSLKVKNSQDQALYVRYLPRKNPDLMIKGDTFPLAFISHPDDPDHIPLLSIPKASLSRLTLGLNAAEIALAAQQAEALQTFPPNDYIRVFEGGVDHSGLPQCTDWKSFRDSLVPPHYTCVEIVGSAGAVMMSCDDTAVTELATALRDGTITTVNIDGTDWRTHDAGSHGIYLGVVSDPNFCVGPMAIRPCISNANWGGIGSGGNATCDQPTQSLGVIFR